MILLHRVPESLGFADPELCRGSMYITFLLTMSAAKSTQWLLLIFHGAKINLLVDRSSPLHCNWNEDFPFLTKNVRAEDSK